MCQPSNSITLPLKTLQVLSYATPMERLHRHLLLLPFFLVVPLLVVRASAHRGAPPDFITTACNNTLYPNVCVGCLSRYAAAIRHNSVRQLAHAAVVVTLSQARLASATVSRLSSGGAVRPADSRTAGAVNDCLQGLANSVQLLRRSVWQMEHMGKPGTDRFRYNLSNLQTSLSGALTAQNTCLDGFPGASPAPNLGATVKGQVSAVAKMTSVTLALVNMINGAQQ